jgi:hypothetical protein
VPFDQVRVVVLGQDPYFNPGEAMGLSFSVPPGVRVPSSLRNIYKCAAPRRAPPPRAVGCCAALRAATPPGSKLSGRPLTRAPAPGSSRLTLAAPCPATATWRRCAGGVPAPCVLMCRQLPRQAPAPTNLRSLCSRRPIARARPTQWCRQGVLLLNASLTVRAGTANSHSKAGWGNLTAAAIAALSQRRSGIVFLLW